MSSDFYHASLSRNLIRTGAFGYRENAGPHILLNIADEVALLADDGRASLKDFTAFPDFGRKGQAGSPAISLGRQRLAVLAASLANRTVSGPLPV